MKNLQKKKLRNFPKLKLIRSKEIYKTFKYNRSPSNPKAILLHKKAVKRHTYKIVIKITPNNVFCTLVKFRKLNRIVCRTSAGILKVAVSKKKLKFSHKIILTKFITQISKIIFNLTDLILLKVIGPIKIRKSIILQFKTFLKKNVTLIIETKPLKCFNGCRPKKQKRKKQKKFQILK